MSFFWGFFVLFWVFFYVLYIYLHMRWGKTLQMCDMELKILRTTLSQKFVWRLYDNDTYRIKGDDASQ